MKLIRPLLATVAVCLLLSTSLVALAGSFSISPANPTTVPGRITHTLPSGATMEDAVKVSNLSEETITLKINAVDAQEPREDASPEAFILKSDQAEKEHVGKWITLSEESVTIEAESEVVVPFTINIPEETEEGLYKGGIAVTLAPETNGENGVSVAVATRVATRVYITVDNTVPEPEPVEEEETTNYVIWIVIGVVVLLIIVARITQSRGQKTEKRTKKTKK